MKHNIIIVIKMIICLLLYYIIKWVIYSFSNRTKFNRKEITIVSHTIILCKFGRRSKYYYIKYYKELADGHKTIIDFIKIHIESNKAYALLLMHVMHILYNNN